MALVKCCHACGLRRLAQSVVLYVLGSVLFVNITILNITILPIIILLLLHTILLNIIIFLHHLLNVQCLREVSPASFLGRTLWK